MAFKKYILLLIFSFLISLNLWARLSCDLIKHLDNPSLYNNVKFWDEYSALSGGGKLNDKTLSDLFKKFDTEVPNPNTAITHPPTSFAPPKARFNLSTTKQADKEIANLPRVHRKNYEEFLGIMVDRSGIQKLYANPGKWHMENLKDNEFSVRLNDGKRVHFKMEGNDLTVIQVNREKVHNL